jgi:hypothetical protein
LGGALAVLLAAFWVFEGGAERAHRLGGVFTFGQPRVGDGPFADAVKTFLPDHKYHRVVFRTDVVPRIPALLGFRHIRPCHFYRNADSAPQVPEKF